jgi:hypothetical protein
MVPDPKNKKRLCEAQWTAADLDLIESERVHPIHGIVVSVRVKINGTVEADRILSEKPTGDGIVVSGAIVVEAGFGVEPAPVERKGFNQRASNAQGLLHAIFPTKLLQVGWLDLRSVSSAIESASQRQQCCSQTAMIDKGVRRCIPLDTGSGDSKNGR